MKRIQGLDSLRFVMAFIVLLGHGTLPDIDLSFIDDNLNVIINAILNNSTVGIAAVMAFFILSGFVIHYPYSEGKSIKIPQFYVKRLVRIGTPGIIAYLVYTQVFSYPMGVIWSLICEAIYYILYPFLFIKI